MKKNSKFIILVIIILLFILLLVLSIFINTIEKNQYLDLSNNTTVNISTLDKNTEHRKNIQEIIEAAGSTFISEDRSVIIKAEVEFKYKLFDKEGKDKKAYFYNIINQVEEIEKQTFRLTDNKNNIEVYAVYDPKTQKYRVYINGVENYYNIVDGDVYNELSNGKEFEYSDMVIDNELIKKIGSNSSIYQNTELVTENKEKLENGYTSFYDGKILAKLQDGKALNIIFKPGYDKKFTLQGIYVGTPLSEIQKKYSKNSFGSIREGYLGYITEYAYIFFYDNEVSVYPYTKKSNEYFDEYIKNYCISGNLNSLVENFTSQWNSYFENESDIENGSFKVSFPVRGIKIDIENNDSTGITLYNNYNLCQDIKDLIIAKKITYKGNKDLVNETEKIRHESM